MSFIPDIAFFERKALEHPRGQKIRDKLKREGKTEIEILKEHNRVLGIPGDTPQIAYRSGKRALVVSIRKTLKFQSCRPSADYQLPLVTGCPGMCQYCYLMTRFGNKPYVRVYVNIEDILEKAEEYAQEKRPEEITFEGAAVSDPIPVEKYTNAIEDSVLFAAEKSNVKFRLATKYTEVGFLAHITHNRQTRIRFSINSQKFIRRFEHDTPSLKRRVAAAAEVAQYGYPLGFLIAPIFYEKNWKHEYEEVLELLRDIEAPFTIELITHRFTPSAKKKITEVFPNTSLDMDEDKRQFKYGQFGYGKYIYTKEERQTIQSWFEEKIPDILPQAEISYLV